MSTFRIATQSPGNTFWTEETAKNFLVDPVICERISRKAHEILAEPEATERLFSWENRASKQLELFMNKCIQTLWPCLPSFHKNLYKQQQHAYMLHFKCALAIEKSLSHYLETTINTPRSDLSSFIQQKKPYLYLRNPPFTREVYILEDSIKAEDGLCQGMSMHFIALLNHICQKNHTTPSEGLLRALTREFEKGGSKQAVFLQTLSPKDFSKLGLIAGAIIPRTLGDTSVSSLKNLPVGTYRVKTEPQGFNKHEMVLIILETSSQKASYLFDPNHGLFHIDDSFFEVLMDSYLPKNTRNSVADYTLTAFSFEEPKENSFSSTGTAKISIL